MSGVKDDKKPADSSAQINLKVKDQDEKEVFFTIKRNTQLKKLMNAYCDLKPVEYKTILFLFDGDRIRGEQTPDELEMEDGDEIDVVEHQIGGVAAAASGGDHGKVIARNIKSVFFTSF